MEAWVVWFTGLSGAGKTTLARGLKSALAEWAVIPFLLDGDEVRRQTAQPLGYEAPDRKRNVATLTSLARSALEQGHPVIVSAMSPFAEGRREARAALGPRFHEVFCVCPLSVLEARDPKGLYLAHRKGQLKNLSGVDAPYERPSSPELLLRTDLKSPVECVRELLALLDYHSSSRLDRRGPR